MKSGICKTSVIGLVVCVTLCSLTAALKAETGIGPGVPGVLNADGSFRAAPIRQTAAPRTNAVTFTGNIALTITVTIASSSARISRTAPVKCTLNANVHNADYTDSIAEVSQATVAISGSQVICKLSIPYSWPLYDPSDDHVFLGYNISFFDDAGNGRNAYVQMPTIALPPSGSSLTYTRATRI